VRRLGLLAFFAMLAGPALADGPVLLHAAGSLRDALTEVTRAYETRSGTTVRARFAASGTLRQAIEGGEAAHVFASANMAHPQRLAAARRASPVVLFARNEMCAFARPGLAVDPQSLIDRLLDPAVRIASSTPVHDPSGDYAYRVFARIDAVRPGARARLEAKNQQLTGGPQSPPPPADGRNVYGHLLTSGAADVFLAYCTNIAPLAREAPGVTAIRLPDVIAVGADYGLTVVTGAPTEAFALALFILSADGQAILERHGFAAPTMPRE
jgi:molybdate transport system substrate-binding protein